jgi:hypothetical protein
MHPAPPPANGALATPERPSYAVLLGGLFALLLLVAAGLGTYFALKPAGSTPSSASGASSAPAVAQVPSSPTAATTHTDAPTAAPTLGPGPTCQRLIPLLQEGADIIVDFGNGRPIDSKHAAELGDELIKLGARAPKGWRIDINIQAGNLQRVANGESYDRDEYVASGTRLAEGCRPYAS